MSAARARRARIHGKIKRGQHWRRRRGCTLVSSAEILKDFYPKWDSPTWSWGPRLALKHRWITYEEFRRLPKWDVTPGLTRLAYERSPVLERLARGNWR